MDSTRKINQSEFKLMSAKTVELALEKVARELGVDKKDLDYELISQTDAGFLSFLGGRKVEIKAWVKTRSNNRRRSNRSEELDEENLMNKEPLTETELAHLVDDLKTFCSGLCKFLVGRSDVQIDAKLDTERLMIDIDDEEVAQLILRNGRLAESLEHILRKKPRYLKRELPFRIFVDARGTRLQREQELIDMARDMSLKVASDQKPIVLNYKSSYDRKIIHMALDKDDRVYTKSIGSGPNRKLMILPAKGDSSEARA